DKPTAFHQAKIGKAVGGSVQQNAGGVLQSLGAGPFLVKLALAELLDRHAVFGAIDLADVEEPHRVVHRIELPVAVEIGLHEMRADADMLRNADLARCALRNQSAALRACTLGDAL